jgi:hypothetical protein
MPENDEGRRVPPGSESMASLRALFLAYPGGLACSRKGIRHPRSISSKMAEKMRKKSDSLIVPKKRVMTVEGRGGHINRSEKETPVTREVTTRWEMALKE